jgi:hypothetical protein
MPYVIIATLRRGVLNPPELLDAVGQAANRRIDREDLAAMILEREMMPRRRGPARAPINARLEEMLNQASWRPHAV